MTTRWSMSLLPSGFHVSPSPARENQRWGSWMRSRLRFFIVSDGRRPMIGFRPGHAPLRQKARVLVAPALNVDEILLPGKQRPLADLLRRRRRRSLLFQPPGQFAHDPLGNLGAVRGIDE